MKRKDLPYDIVFLLKRLNIVVEREEYERAAVIKRWIDELMVFYQIEEESLESQKKRYLRKI